MRPTQAPSPMASQILAATSALLLVAALLGQALAAPMPAGEQADLDDLGDDGVDSPQLTPSRRHNAAQLDGAGEADFGGPSQAAGSGGNFNNDMGQQQYQNFRPQQQQQHYGQPQMGATNYQNALQQQASENNENSAEDNETDADDDSDFGAMGLTSGNAGAASSAHGNGAGYRPWSGADESALQSAGSSSPSGNLNYQGEADVESAALDGSGEPDGLDSNIANAKIEMSPRDMATAAGHHHHHGHYVHGWLKMGAETGKKGAFKWHDKHPVGGKGRR